MPEVMMMSSHISSSFIPVMDRACAAPYAELLRPLVGP